jgi:hypothetical protein
MVWLGKPQLWRMATQCVPNVRLYYAFEHRLCYLIQLRISRYTWYWSWRWKLEVPKSRFCKGYGRHHNFMSLSYGNVGFQDWKLRAEKPLCALHLAQALLLTMDTYVRSIRFLSNQRSLLNFLLLEWLVLWLITSIYETRIERSWMASFASAITLKCCSIHTSPPCFEFVFSAPKPSNLSIISKCWNSSLRGRIMDISLDYRRCSLQS